MASKQLLTQKEMSTKASLVLIINLVTISVSSMAFAETGTATFYDQYIPSKCYGNEDQGVMIAAASDTIWNNGDACGFSYMVTCTGPTDKGIPQPCKEGFVRVKIVDHCPAGCAATIDLSKEAFAMIANPDAGKINIQYSPYD